MLSLHAAQWQTHPANSVRYTLIDDCSPIPINKKFTTAPVDIYRVKEDIPWNIAGARNLCFHVAQTDWVLCSDIDHIVTREALTSILALDRSDPNVVYTFGRRTPEGFVGVDAIINILMNKKKYFEIGGYDEDFSHRYGREETFFQHCLRANKVKIVKRDDIILAWYPKIGATSGLLRDKSENAIIFDRKMEQLKSKTYTNGPLLRFEWELLNSEKRGK